MSRHYSTARLVGAERAKEKYARLMADLRAELAMVELTLSPPDHRSLVITEHEAIRVRLRHAAALAQELENLAKGNPAPPPGL